MTIRFALFASLLLAAPHAGAATAAKPAAATRATLAPELFKELSARAIGPATMGGRVSAIASLDKDPSTIWLGLGTGGVFKSTNLGTTWSAVFEKEAVASIGDIAIWQKNPSVVWVGTGEANNRNSSSWGNGVYVTRDGGGKWENVGLEATQNISRVIVDPSDSNAVYVAALGRLWGENPERGVFKTSDGGKSWQHVLKADAKTGACDLVMDPSDPQVLYAAMYSRKRSPWSYTSGGTSGGIFRTRDGGRTWKKLAGGLPLSTGRIGLDVYRANPRKLFAVVESDEGGHLDEFESKSRTGGVFRSDDGGETWKRLSAWTPRPLYFSQIRVQPNDSSRVYLCGFDLFVSNDGGATFRPGGARNLHPDLHPLWIAPGKPEQVYVGTDGGFFVSFDRTANWRFIDNLPAGEFYTVTADNRDPYWVYGGLQDNQSWGGPSRTRFEAETWLDENQHWGSLNRDWFLLGGGDGFYVQVDPTDPDIVYYESQGAYLSRVNLRSGKERTLRPSGKEGEPRFRFNWNAPFQISPHDPTVLWLGGNHVFRLYQRGDRWELASPDLTTRDPAKMATGGSAAETHCTVVTLAESPVAAGTIWAGTDDGKLWVTTDAGKQWTDLSANLPSAARGLYMSRIEASHHDARVAYLAVDGHRTDVYATLAYRTADGGRTWQSIAGDLPKDRPVKVVREDLRNPNVLFAGTEFGLFVTLDRGVHWMKGADNLPTVAVDDLHVHPRERDLLVATHGRSLYILDDITPWEQWSDSALVRPVTLFEPRPATAYYHRPIGGVWGQANFAVKNPAFGAYFNYFVKEWTGEGVSIEVSDSSGTKLRSLSGPGTPGLHRITWDLQREPKERMDRTEWQGQAEFVNPGRYKLRLTYGKEKPIDRLVEVRVAPETLDPQEP